MVFLDSFTCGCFDILSKSGRQGISFEDSDRFGPMKVNMRSGELSEIPAGHWFWDFYDDWRSNGRPTDGVKMTTPNGPLERAVWP